MALESTAQHLRPLDTKANPTIFNCENRRLRDTRSLRKLVLSEVLQLAKNSDRLHDGHLYPILGGAIVFRFYDCFHRCPAIVLGAESRPWISMISRMSTPYQRTPSAPTGYVIDSW